MRGTRTCAILEGAMELPDIKKLFSDRLYEQCLLLDTTPDDLAEELSKNFDKKWLKLCFPEKEFSKDFDVERLKSCFAGKEMFTDILLISIARYFKINVDSFFELGERVTEKSAVIPAIRERKIKHLEEVLGRKIPYTANNFESILESAVSEALDKELMSLSKAAAILNVSVEYAMKL